MTLPPRAPLPTAFACCLAVSAALAQSPSAEVTVRVPVRPPATAADAGHDLFLVEEREAFLEVRVPRAALGTDGTVTAKGLRVTGTSPAVLRLFSPAGFGLEIAGGTVDLEGSRVGALDLRGRLHLPASYGGGSIAFASLKRSGDPAGGFETGELAQGMPRVTLGAYAYRPEKAKFRFRARVDQGIPARATLDAPLRPAPETTEAIDAWEQSVRGDLAADGLLAWGGVLAAPWPVVDPPRPPAPTPPAPPKGRIVPGFRPIGGMVRDGKLFNRTLELGTPIAQLPKNLLPALPPPTVAKPTLGSRAATPVASVPSARLEFGLSEVGARFPFRHGTQGGAFVLDASGAHGQWVILGDPETRRVGAFRARVERTNLGFFQSALRASEVRGKLLIPYPADVEIGFRGTLTSGAAILVADGGLEPPDDESGWYLDYWKLSLFPRGSEGPVALYAPDRLTILDARLRLEVPEAFGGQEFTRRGGGEPFRATLSIDPDGQIDDVRVRPAPGGRLEFLGIPFDTSRDRVNVRRYVGDHRRPAKDAPAVSTPLVEIEGTLSFDLFGPRAARIEHTAMGARVPFVEPTASDAAGNPRPVAADSSGVLLVDARLRFVNTFGMPASIVTSRFPPKGVDPNRPFEPQGGASLVVEPFKAFVGEGKFEVLDTLSMNGLAEAGLWLKDGKLRRYEKLGVGGGVDVVKGVLAGLRGAGTAAKLGGAGVEILTGAKGLGAEVIHVASDAVMFGNSIVTTSLAAAGTGASAGGATPVLADEVRHLVGSGLDLTDSSLDLTKAIYEQKPFYTPANPDPKTDPPYVALEVADLLVSSAALGVEFEEITPEDLARLTLQSLDTAVPILEGARFGDRASDQKADLALAVAHPMVKAARAWIEDGRIAEPRAWEIAAGVVDAGRRFNDLDEVKGKPEFRGLPLALAVAEVAVDVGRQSRTGTGGPDLPSLVNLADRILEAACADDRLLQPLFDAAIVPAKDARNVAAASRAAFHRANDPAFLAGTLPPERVVTEVVLPLLDDLVEGRSPASCPGPIRFDPYDPQARALLRLARQVLRAAEVAPQAGASPDAEARMFAWSLGVVVESMNAVNAMRPDTVDPRVVDSAAALRAAPESVKPGDAPATALVKVVHGSIPGVRTAVAAIPGVDRAAPEAVDVVGATLGASVPVLETGGVDLATWLSGAIDVLRQARELPLGPEALSGIAIATTTLEVSRDGAKGTLTGPQLVASARRLLELLKLGRPAGSAPDPAVDVAAAALRALEETFGRGSLSIPGVGDLLGEIARASSPAGSRPAAGSRTCDGIAAIDPALRGLATLDPTVDNATAAGNALRALLDAEEATTKDPAVIAAVRAARGALTAPVEIVLGAEIDPVLLRGFDPAASRRTADPAGGSRSLLFFQPQGGARQALLVSSFPQGHPRFPGGLEEVLAVPASVPGIDGDPKSAADLEALATAIAAMPGVVPESRAYRDAEGRRVRFERRPDAASRTTVIEPISFGPFQPLRVFDADTPPRAGQNGAELSGPLVRAAWRETSLGKTRHFTWDATTAMLRIDRLDLAGAFEVRAAGVEPRPRRVEDLPKDGRLVAYLGDHPQLPSDAWRVEWRAGIADLLVHDGRSYDRRANDPLLVAGSAAAIRVDGTLLEARRVLDDGATALVKPGVNVLVARPCGEWKLHATGPVAERFPTGELLVRGDAQGKIFRPDGSPLAPEAAAALGIKVEPGRVRIAWPEGDVVLDAGGGTTAVLPGTSRESIETCSAGESVVRFALGALRGESRRDGKGGVVERRFEPVGDRTEIVGRPGGDLVRRTSPESGLEEVAVEGRVFAYDPREPLVPAGATVPSRAPAERDPARAAIVPMLNRFEGRRTGLIAGPSTTGILELRKAVDAARRDGWLIPGMAARARQAEALALASLLEDDLDALAKGEARAQEGLLLRLGFAADGGHPVSARVAATFARFVSPAGGRHPVRAAIEAAGTGAANRCDDPEASLRLQGALELGAVYLQARTAEGADPLRAELQAGLDAVAQAQNACLSQALTATPVSPFSLSKAIADARRRQAAATRLGLEDRWPAADLARAAAALVRATAPPLDGAGRSASSVEAGLPAYLDAIAEQQALAIVDPTVFSSGADAATFVATERLAALGRTLDACPLERQTGCNPATLSGCRLDRLPTCRPDAVREALASAVRAVSSASAAGAEVANPPDADLERAMRVTTLESIVNARAGILRGDVRATIAAFRTAEDAFAQAQLLGVSLDAARSRLEALTAGLVTIVSADLERAKSDPALRTAIGVALYARDNGAAGGALDPLVAKLGAEQAGLRDRDLGRLRTALRRPRHDAAEIEGVLSDLDVSIDGFTLLVDPKAQPDALPLFDLAVAEFGAALGATPAPQPALPEPDPLPLSDRLEPPFAERYTRLLVAAWLQGDTSGSEGRARAVQYLRAAAATYRPEIAAHRNALVSLASFVRRAIDRDAQRRAVRGLPPVPASQDILASVLADLAGILDDEALRHDAGTFVAEDTRRRARAAADDVAAGAAAGIAPDYQALLAEIRRDADAEVAALPGTSTPIDDTRQARLLFGLASREPGTVLLAAETGRIASPEARLAAAFAPDRFAAVASALQPALARGGPNVRLAHRLASQAPGPIADPGIGWRFGAIGNLAGFVADGIVCPGQGNPADLKATLDGVLRLTQPQPGIPLGRRLGELAKSALGTRRATGGGAAATAGVNVAAAAIDGALAALFPAPGSGPAVDWTAVLDQAATSLAAGFKADAPPGEYWPGLGGKLAKLGLDLQKGRSGPDVFAKGVLEVSGTFLDQRDVRRITDAVPEPGASMIATTKGLLRDTLSNLGAGDPMSIALARVLSRAAFERAPAPWQATGLQLSGWGLDFARANRPLFDGAFTASPAGRVAPLAALTGALLKADGLPRLACAVNGALPADQRVPTPIAIAPVAFAHGMFSSPDLASAKAADRPRAALDGFAGLMNAWLARKEAYACPSPQGVPEADVPFAGAVRGLKGVDGRDPKAAFDLVGRFGLGAVDAFAPGSTLARSMHTVWWGQETPPAPGTPYLGLGTALRGDVADSIELAFKTPKIAADVVRILSSDPSLAKTMRLLGGDCRAEDLLPPDACRKNTPGRNEGTLPNFVLATLADVRRGMRPGLSAAQHGSDPQWGFLRTLPALGPPASGDGGMLDLTKSLNPANWKTSVDLVKNLERLPEAAQRGGLAAVDLSRAAVSAIASLPPVQRAGPSARAIQEGSIFAPQVGGETFSGLAGGLMREWDYGAPPRDADLYFELFGQFNIPALLRSGARLSYQTEGNDWMLALQAGANQPDLTNIADDIGVRIPANDIASAYVGSAQGSFSGWIGASGGSPYIELFASARADKGAVKLGEVNLSGFAQDFRGADPLQVAQNLDVGMCVEQETQLNPASVDPTLSAMTLGFDTTATVGAYFFKRDATAGFGAKLGTSTGLNVPVVPIAGIRLGVDVGLGAETTLDLRRADVGFQLSQCIRPYVSGYFLGVRLEDLDANIETAQFVKTMNVGGKEIQGEVGTKFRLRIADTFYGDLRDNLDCDEPPGPIEIFLCDQIDRAGPTLGAWMVLSTKGFYFGLGGFPSDGDWVPGATFKDDGSLDLPFVHEVKGWGGFTQSPFSTCAADVCGNLDDPPAGARVRGER